MDKTDLIGQRASCVLKMSRILNIPRSFSTVSFCRLFGQGSGGVVKSSTAFNQLRTDWCSDLMHESRDCSTWNNGLTLRQNRIIMNEENTERKVTWL